MMSPSHSWYFPSLATLIIAQFFILLVGVMVFVFYQFETSPLHFNPKGVETVLNSPHATAYQKLEEEHRATQILRHAMLEKNIDETTLENLAKIDGLERTQRQKAKLLIKKADPQQETNDKDYVFISFILGYLPQGIVGLLLAVILSAAMSSTASELNALAATTTVDLYQRNVGEKSPAHLVKASQGFTLLWGGIAILFAAFGSLVENLIQLVNIIGSVFYGTILGVFLVAFFLKQVKGNPVFWAAIVSEALVIFIFTQDWVSFLWLNVIGAVLTVGIALLLQQYFMKK